MLIFPDILLDAWWLGYFLGTGVLQLILSDLLPQDILTEIRYQVYLIDICVKVTVGFPVVEEFCFRAVSLCICASSRALAAKEFACEAELN